MAKTKEDIQRIILKRMTQEQVAIRTVGDLMSALKKYDKNTPVLATQYFECITSSGTNMGSDDQCAISGIVDLDTRIIIEVNRSPFRNFSDKW